MGFWKMNLYIIYGLIIGGIISFIFLIGFLIIFWKIIYIQTRYWFLAKKGYIKVEHVGEDKVKRIYFLKPTDTKFEFDNGIYFFQKDSLVKTDIMFPKIDKDMLSKKLDTELTAEEKQYKELLQKVGKFKYMHDSDVLTWGVPTLTYYGQDPNPVHYADRKKVYDSKVISSYIKRILLEKEWKFIRTAFIIILVFMGLLVVEQVLVWQSVKKSADNNAQLVKVLNQTISEYNKLVNETKPIYQQQQLMINNSGLII